MTIQLPARMPDIDEIADGFNASLGAGRPRPFPLLQTGLRGAMTIDLEQFKGHTPNWEPVIVSEMMQVHAGGDTIIEMGLEPADDWPEAVAIETRANFALACSAPALLTEVRRLKEALTKHARQCELLASAMRDNNRTGGWKGAETVAQAFDRQARNARSTLSSSPVEKEKT